MNPFDTEPGRAALEKVGFARRMKARPRDASQPSDDAIVAMMDWLAEEAEWFHIMHQGGPWQLEVARRGGLPRVSTADTLPEALIAAVVATKGE